MDIRQNINEPAIHFGALEQKWKTMPATNASSDNMNESFDCNICLDAAHDPVVTLCGHLYCWPCIYKWIQVQSSPPEQAKCPICKACISGSTLVPLYGRGMSSSDSQITKVQPDYKIPGRPQALGQTAMPSQPQHHSQYIPHALRNYASMSPSSFSGSAVTNFYGPTVWMFGEMVSARFFGGNSNLFGYPHPTSYPPEYSSPRIRRQEQQVHKSLNRVSIFLLCCLVLCLLLF
ncbi:hypothetical protein Leryth_010079 [Lithospermum erythrorhizon]|nr:hypothetical protein Leryth_010079 [Lithospermum erythrorhizon]